MSSFLEELNKWRKEHFKYIRKCYETDVFALQPDVSSIIEDNKLPERTNTISNDDITNLKIILGNCQSVDDLLNNL